MTKLEQAARQALEALEVYGEHAKDCPQYPTYTRPQDYPKCDCGFDQAIPALREALAEQAEQEPVGYFAYDEEHDIWEELTGPNAPGATPLYTAPVRTKDLTDDEIAKALGFNIMLVTTKELKDARAVIAAYKEKNK